MSANPKGRLPPFDIARPLHSAHDRDIVGILRPYLDGASLARAYWRGSIQPRDRGAWFASYGGLLREYAALAEREWAEGLVIGSEFVSSRRTSAG